MLKDRNSVSNGSGLELEPEPNHGNGFTKWNTRTVDISAGFHLKTPSLQAQMFRSNYVFEYWSYHDMMYTQIVQFLPLFHLPISDLRSDQYLLSRRRKPENFS
jgi:hypothetical protein